MLTGSGRNSGVRRRGPLAAGGVQERDAVYNAVAMSDVRGGHVVLPGEEGGDCGQPEHEWPRRIFALARRRGGGHQ